MVAGLCCCPFFQKDQINGIFLIASRISQITGIAEDVRF